MEDALNRMNTCACSHPKFESTAGKQDGTKLASIIIGYYTRFVDREARSEKAMSRQVG